MTPTRTIISILAILLMVCATGCEGDANASLNPPSKSAQDSGSPPSHQAEGDSSAQEELPAPLADAEITDSQQQLLDVAFEVASSIPVNPHAKDRARAQQAVLEACIELDRPVHALEINNGIIGWRKGLGYAKVAAYCAEHGITDMMEYHLAIARQIADKEEEWRRDRINVQVAVAEEWRGEQNMAKYLEQDIDPSEVGKVDAVRAAMLDDSIFESQLERTKMLAEASAFDPLRNAMHACVVLYDRFYEDTDRRARVEDVILSSWVKTPTTVRIALMSEMLDVALEHNDTTTAMRLLAIGEAELDARRIHAEQRLPVLATLASGRFASGDVDGATRLLTRANHEYNAEKTTIINMFRAEALRPIAVATHEMKDRDSAIEMFNLVLSTGLENTNQRPRATDLSATCLAMALAGFEPDEAMWNRIREIKEALIQQ